jgi:serine/threonine-protein kinase
MVAQLARGLDQAHRQRFVHRDIKPDNVFLCGTPDGDRVKLLDFGSVRDNTEGAKKLTVIGTTIGSPYYMSPEQAQGLRELDHRADVWSVAAITYECLTGKLPFPGKSGPAILLAILGQEPEPPTIAAADRQLPALLDDVLADALAKDMKTRVGSLGELADRLGQAFGLRGSHLEWLGQPEATLGAAIEQARLAPPAPAEPGGVSWPVAALDGAVPDASGPQPAPFVEEEDFAMGVPQGPPWGVIALFGAGLLLLVGAVVAYLLLS